MVKLFLHNMLSSAMLKGVVEGYPLLIRPKEVEYKAVDFDLDYVKRVIPSVDFSALNSALSQVQELVPEAITKISPPLMISLEALDNVSEELLRRIHTALFEIEIVSGELVCPESGRVFPVTNTIANMLANEDELE